jgi:hypothetical protein
MMTYLPMVALVGCFITVGVAAYLIKNPQDKGTESSRMRFAAANMTGLFLIFIFAMSIYAGTASNAKDAGKDIFEGCMKAFPPIATLVIGYWFGAKNGNGQSPGTDSGPNLTSKTPPSEDPTATEGKVDATNKA